MQYIIIIIIIIIIISIYGIHKIKNNEKYKALKRLCNLSTSELDAYFNSYDEIFSDNSMISTLDDYKSNKPPSRFIIPKETKASKYTADCYNILTELCALGNVKKMYIPPCINPNKGILENQILYEKILAKNLNTKYGEAILEIGCGCGRIADHISDLTDSTVCGINIDEKQLDDARNYAKQKKTNNKFIFCDFNDALPFADETFDAIYTIQGLLSFTSDHDKVFNELFRVLKPGGRFIILDAVLLDAFDRNNEHHLKLMKNTRQVSGGALFVHHKYIEDSAQKAKFEIISSKGGDPPNEAAELPLLIAEHNHFEKIETIIKYLTKFRILPNYMNDLLKRLRAGGDDLVEMEEKNLLTMDWEFILEKPHKTS